MDETLQELAFALADESAMLTVKHACKKYREIAEWDVIKPLETTQDRKTVERAIRYLRKRGLIVRNCHDHTLVKFITP